MIESWLDGAVADDADTPCRGAWSTWAVPAGEIPATPAEAAGALEARPVIPLVGRAAAARGPHIDQTDDSTNSFRLIPHIARLFQ